MGRRFSEQLGQGASIFQDWDPGEALSAGAKPRPTRERASLPRRPNPLENQKPETRSDERCHHPL